MWATLRQHAPIVEYLLRNGANVHTTNSKGQTAIDMISTEMIRTLFSGRIRWQNSCSLTFLDAGTPVPRDPPATSQAGASSEGNPGGVHFVPNYIRYPVITPELKAVGDGKPTR
jgi:hypothetical protein